MLWRITACTSLSNLFTSITGAMLVLFALRLGLDPAQLGLAFGVGAIGGLLGALVVTTGHGLGRRGTHHPAVHARLDAGRRS